MAANMRKRRRIGPNMSPDELSDEHTAASGFRARLCPTPEPRQPAREQSSQHDNIYRRVCASLQIERGPQNRQPQPAGLSTDGNEPTGKLRESLARAGAALHSSAMKQLLQNHGEIESKISDFSHDASATLAQIEVLYANIAYPLDATLCHSDGLPHATIAGHFVNLREHAREAEETLRKLADEHEACISAEDTTLKEMSRAMDGSGQESKADSAVDQRKMEAFKKEALAIAADKNQVLEEIDTEYRQSLQVETMKMMQSVMED